MEKTYTSKYGKISKKCPGLPEYWYHGQLIAKGNALSSANPNDKPTKEDWEFCVSIRDK